MRKDSSRQSVIYQLCRWCISLSLLLFAHQAFALYTFPGALPPGCTGAAGVYVCTALNLQDHVQFNDTGNVTITVNGDLTFGGYTFGSAADSANVTFKANGNVYISFPTIYASIDSGIYSIFISASPAITGNLKTTSGIISAKGTINGNVSSTTGYIALNDKTTVNGNVSSTTGAIYDYNNSVVNGSVSTSSGYIYLYGNNVISSTVSCSTCQLTIYNGGNRIVGAVTVGVLDDTAGSATLAGTIYSSSITALTGNAYVGYYANVTGDVTAFNNVVIRDRANVTGNITSNNDIEIRYYSTVTGSLTTNATGSTTINVLDYATINGSISARTTGSLSTARIYLIYNTLVNGDVTSNSPYSSYVDVYSTSTLNGDLTSFGGGLSTVSIWGKVNGNVRSTSTDVADGDIYLWYNTTKVDGSLFVSGDIYNYGIVTGCAQTSKASTLFDLNNVYLYSGSSTAGTCQGTTSCSTDLTYVYRDFFVSMPPICTFNATKIASYSLDELSWNGTANEVKDTAGFTGGPFDGQGEGAPVPTSNTISPARAGTTGTCGYATFSGATNGGSAFTLDGLPVSTAAGDQTSVSFWMYWNGTNYVQPLGWRQYNLFFSDGNFGFNTGAYDIWGLSSSGLANGWHHVAAVFANGNVANSKLYIDGVLRTLGQIRSFDVNNANAYVQSTLDISGWTLDTSWRFTGGRIDEVRVYKGAMTQAQVTADFNETHLCPVYNVVPSKFNCVVVGGDASTGRLYTQLVGSPFSLDIVALKSTGAVETNYVVSGTKNVTLEFVDGSGATVCGSRPILNPAVSQSVSFSLADAGRKTISNINITKAYRDLRCRVTDANQTPSVVGCSVDDFAVRPASLSVSTTNATADSAGVSTTASPAIKAGASFNLTAASGVVGYDGTPIIDSTKLNAHSGAVHLGVLSGGFSAANATTGTAVGNAFNYSEVGYFNVGAHGVYDSTFTAVDSANGDCATGFVSAGGKQACSFGNSVATNYFGRFIPDHFAVTSGATIEGCDSGNFTYYGQDGFSTPFSLRAENTSNQITQNYIGNYAKLGLNSWANYSFNSQGAPYSPELIPSATAPTGAWVNGSATVNAKHQISRLSAMVPQSPKCSDEYNFCPFSGTRLVIYGANGVYTSGTYTNGVSCTNDVFGDPLFGTVKACYLANLPSPSTISVFARPTDSDGVTMPNTAVSTASLFRYGRLIMPNVYGSELLPLSTTIEAQYWNGKVYQRNQLDSCSVIPANTIAMGSYRNNLAACETQLSGAGTLSAGKTIANLSKPGAGNHGSVDLTINLNGATGSTCNSASPSSAGNANIPWFGNSPSARATFGLFKSPVIYMRESY